MLLRLNLMRKLMIHTDRGSAYCLSMFNDDLASKNCIHSMSHPGYPWENLPIERWWNDFKLIWINKHNRPKTLAELEQLVKGAIEYFNTKRAYTIITTRQTGSLHIGYKPIIKAGVSRCWLSLCSSQNALTTSPPL